MLSSKKIICPQNLLNLTKKNKNVNAAIVNAGNMLAMTSAMIAVKENLIRPVFIGDKKKLLNLLMI